MRASSNEESEGVMRDEYEQEQQQEEAGYTNRES